MARRKITDSAGFDQRQSGSYRADIDGLRAVAVLPILAFHLGIRLFQGGYVGVDIFFVISGYLIGGNVIRQMQDGRYSVLEFYTRRFRRIIPALAFMLLLTTLAVLVLSLPGATVDYGKSLVSTVLFSSNFYFFGSSGYFAGASDAKPLLHTWSLSVEEQFYILFPLLIFACRHAKVKTLLGLILGVAIASLAASVLLLPAYTSATFFLLPTRLWELLLGVLAAIIPWQFLEKGAVREAVTLVSALLIAYPILFYSPQTPFPGIAAMLPCLGTAVLLGAGAQGSSLVSRALSLRPLVYVGLISYSLYLWHWPVIVLLKHGLLVTGIWHKAIATLVSFVLAWVSWRMVERP